MNETKSKKGDEVGIYLPGDDKTVSGKELASLLKDVETRDGSKDLERLLDRVLLEVEKEQSSGRG